MRVVLVDGVPSASGLVAIDADDPGLTLGVGVFESLRTYGGRVFGLDAHLARLAASAASCGVPIPGHGLLAQELRAAAAARAGESALRVTLTAGRRRIVRAGPLPVLPAVYRCATRPWTPPEWLPGHVKHTSRAASVAAVRASGCDEVLWTDAQGAITEGTTCNVFAVRDGALLTPPLGAHALPGVTRAGLLDAAARLGVPAAEAALYANLAYDELYVSSTYKELRPVVSLDGAPAPGGGPVGAAVLAEFRAEATRTSA